MVVPLQAPAGSDCDPVSRSCARPRSATSGDTSRATSDPAQPTRPSRMPEHDLVQAAFGVSGHARLQTERSDVAMAASAVSRRDGRARPEPARAAARPHGRRSIGGLRLAERRRTPPLRTRRTEHHFHRVLAGPRQACQPTEAPWLIRARSLNTRACSSHGDKKPPPTTNTRDDAPSVPDTAGAESGRYARTAPGAQACHGAALSGSRRHPGPAVRGHAAGLRTSRHFALLVFGRRDLGLESREWWAFALTRGPGVAEVTARGGGLTGFRSGDEDEISSEMLRLTQPYSLISSHRHRPTTGPIPV